MSGHTSTDDDVPESLTKALAKFAQNFENFASGLRDWRESYGPGFEDTIGEVLGEGSPSFVRTLDEITMLMLASHLYFLKVLKDATLGLGSRADEKSLPQAKGEAFGLRNGEKPKLLNLEEKIHDLRVWMEHDPAIPEAGDVAARPRDGGSTTVPDELESSISHLSLEELQSEVASLRKTYFSSSDLQVRMSGDSEILSLHYYLVPNGAGEKVALLDLESFVTAHRMALAGARRLTRSLVRPEDLQQRRVGLAKVQAFLKTLYANVRTVLAPQGRRLLPFTGGKIDRDLLLNFEALLSIKEWTSDKDVEHFRSLFLSRVEGPIKELLSEPEGRRRYVESIVSAATFQHRGG